MNLVYYDGIILDLTMFIGTAVYLIVLVLFEIRKVNKKTCKGKQPFCQAPLEKKSSKGLFQQALN